MLHGTPFVNGILPQEFVLTLRDLGLLGGKNGTVRALGELH
jgi:hypothetical protein